MDLSNFLERQRLTDEKEPSSRPELIGQLEDEDDVDHTLDHLMLSTRRQQGAQKKGKIEALEWDNELESMAREKAAAEATWGLSDVAPVKFGLHWCGRFERTIQGQSRKASKSPNT